MNSVTTTENFGLRGFRRENITLKKPRMQSEILNEIPREQVVDKEPEVPVSNSPEQVMKYLSECASSTKDMQKKHIFTLAVKWIRENEDRKRAEIAEKVKAFANSKVEKSDDSIIDDIEVDTK